MRDGVSPHAVGARIGAYAVSTRGDRTLEHAGSVRLPLVDGSVSWSTGGGTVAQARLEFPGNLAPASEWSPLMPYGQRLRIVSVYEVGGRTVEVPLGVFHISRTVEHHSHIEVTALSLDYLIQQDPAAFPSSPERGATLLDEARRLAGGVPVELDAGVANPVLPTGLSWGFDRWKALQDLGASNGVNWVFRVDECLHGVAATGGGREVDLRLAASEAVVEVEGAREWSAFNKVTVISEQKDGEGHAVLADDSISMPVDWEALTQSERDALSAQRATQRAQVLAQREAERQARENEESHGSRLVSHTAWLTHAPFQPGLYGVRGKRIELEAGASEEQCALAAHRFLAESALTGRVVRVNCLPDPRIELGDIVSVSTDNTPLVGRVCGVDLPLSHRGSMRLDLEEVLW